MEALAVEAAPRHRADAGPRLHRDHVGGDHLLAGCAEALAEGEGAGEGARGRVDDPRHVGVVVVEAMDKKPVRHRRVPQGEPPWMTDDRRFSRAPGVGTDERIDAGEGWPGEVEAVRRERDADRVKDEMTGPDPDLAGDVLVAKTARELGQFGCDVLRNRFDSGSGYRRTAHRLSPVSPLGSRMPRACSHGSRRLDSPRGVRARAVPHRFSGSHRFPPPALLRRSCAGTAPRSRTRPALPCRRP